jgi:hypothetical protein
LAARLHQFINSLFTADFKTQPYWWGRNSRQPLVSAAALPARVEVAVVRSGDTGLNAALHIARGGRTTLVLDAEAAGWGCCSRIGGQISTSTKPEFDALARRHGGARHLLRTPSWSSSSLETPSRS